MRGLRNVQKGVSPWPLRVTAWGFGYPSKMDIVHDISALKMEGFLLSSSLIYEFI